MSLLRMWGWMAAVVVLAAAANRASAQLMYGGTLRYGSPFGYPRAVTSYRGPLGGRVTVTQGPFGGGAVSVRGPFGGRVTVARPGVVPVVPAPMVPAVPQTVLNPAPNLNWPYSAAYLARIPPGYATLEIGAMPYYYTSLLPPGSQSTIVGGTNMFVSNGLFYQPYFYGGRMVYVVVQR